MPALLSPLYALSCPVGDMEADNQAMNGNLRRIQGALRAIAPSATDWQTNDLQWICWWELFRGNDDPVDDKALSASVQKALATLSQPGYKARQAPWDPFHAD